MYPLEHGIKQNYYDDDCIKKISLLIDLTLIEAEW